MFNLRSQYFEQIEEIYKDIQQLSRHCNLSRIKHNIYLLWNYRADDEKFTSYIESAINRLNQIINFSLYGELKEKLVKLYNKLLELLPSDLQLELPLNVEENEPIAQAKRKKITWIQKYLWRQLTLSDIFLFPQIQTSVWENGYRRF